MVVNSSGSDLDQLIEEQVTYYRAVADEFDDLLFPFPGGEELVSALDDFKATGDVLELACGPGSWTSRLVADAATVTAIDSSPEMLAIAKTRVKDSQVRWVQADLFGWKPDRRYDVVFFGAWLSHVPLERFDSFWSTVGESLVDHGRVFFVDDSYRTQILGSNRWHDRPAPDSSVQAEISGTGRAGLLNLALAE